MCRARQYQKATDPPLYATKIQKIFGKCLFRTPFPHTPPSDSSVVAAPIRLSSRQRGLLLVLNNPCPSDEMCALPKPEVQDCVWFSNEKMKNTAGLPYGQGKSVSSAPHFNYSCE